MGDWVALNPEYAKSHMRGKLYSKTVPVEDVVWSGGDFNEYVYSPQKIRDQFPSLANFYNQVIKKAEPKPLPKPLPEVGPEIKPEVPKELEPLAEEARKYKSAEEFVKNMGYYDVNDRFIFHGTGKKEAESIIKNGFKTDSYNAQTAGISFTNEPQFAKFFARERAGYKDPALVIVDKNSLKIAKLSNFEKQYDKMEWDEFRNFLIKKGYDGLDWNVGESLAAQEGEITIFNIKKIKPLPITDLVDFYNQAVKGAKPKVKPALEPETPPKAWETKQEIPSKKQPAEAKPQFELTRKGATELGITKLASQKSQITPKRKELIEGKIFDIVSIFTPTKSPVPILKKIVIDKNKIITTDLETAIIYESDVDFKMRRALPPKLLKGKGIKDVETIASKAEGMETIEDYPIIPEIKKPIAKAKISIKPNVLKKLITSIGDVKGWSETSGVLFQSTARGLTLVSTDIYRLWKITLPIKTPPNFKFILPGESVKKLTKLLDKVAPDEIMVELEKEWASFSFDKFRVISRPIDAEFPNYKLIMPTEIKTAFEVDRMELLNAIREAKSYVPKTNNIWFIAKKNVLKIFTERPEDKVKFEKEIPAAIKENIKISPEENQHLIMPIFSSDTTKDSSLNINYIEDFLRTAETERISGSLEKNKPTVWREVLSEKAKPIEELTESQADQLLSKPLPEVKPKVKTEAILQSFSVGRLSSRRRSFFDISNSSPNSSRFSEALSFVGRQVKDSLSKISTKGDPSAILKIDPDDLKYLNVDEFFSIAPLLYHKAQKNAREFVEMLRKIGFRRASIDIKEVESLAEKVIRKTKQYGKYSVSQINDLLRGTVVVADEKQTLKVVESLGNKIKKFDNYFDNPTNGYRGINADIRLADGSIVELQIHTPASLENAESLHDLYNSSIKKQKLKEIAPSTKIKAEVSEPIFDIAEEARKMVQKYELFRGVRVSPEAKEMLLKADPNSPVFDFIEWYKKNRGEYLDRSVLRLHQDGEPHFRLLGLSENAKISSCQAI